MSTKRESQVSDVDECPCSGGTLAKLIQPAVMTILAGGPLHGYRIVQRVAEMPTLGGSCPDPTGVYRTLRIMDARGFVVSTWDVSGSGPARRLYRLTPEGRACLDRWAKTLGEYRQAIGKLLSAARTALDRLDEQAEEQEKKGET